MNKFKFREKKVFVTAAGPRDYTNKKFVDEMLEEILSDILAKEVPLA